MREINVPHVYGLSHEGKSIPIYYQLPSLASASSAVPVIIIITGGDGYRTELVVWAEGWRALGVGVIILEIPGTGDSPADPKDPKGMDRVWSSLFYWISTQPEIDREKLITWGFSTGGYYALRVAHTHKDNLLASISHGGGAHYMFDPEWINEINHLEYPFE